MLWGLDDNFDKDILVLGRGSLGGCENRGVCSVRGEGGVRFSFLPGIPLFFGICSKVFLIGG